MVSSGICPPGMSAKGEHMAQGRPFAEQEGPAGALLSASDKHTHREKDYCQLVYSHEVIFLFRKLELSLKEKKWEKREHSIHKAASGKQCKGLFSMPKTVNNENFWTI